MRTMMQLVGGVAVAGAVAAGSTAFTAAGFTNNAGAQFVGGTVTQAVTGATLSTISYAFSNAPANTRVTSVTLTFVENLTGRTVTLAETGGTHAVTSDMFHCPASTTTSVTCRTALAADSPAFTAAGYYQGLTSMDITVA
jgi:hypothetical protein